MRKWTRIRRLSFPFFSALSFLYLIIVARQHQQAMYVTTANIAPCKIDIVVMSDRNDSQVPLKGLVNSILQFTTLPVAMHIITTAKNIPWLEQLHSSFFQINLYDPVEHGLYNRTQQLMNQTSFNTSHYSAKFALQKIYLPVIPFHGRPKKILMLDDDIIFYHDISPLWNLLYKNPNRLSLYCPVDPFFAKFYFAGRNASHNGDSRRYCISGMIGFPIHYRTSYSNKNFYSPVVDLLENATANMMQEYPDVKYTVADQDIVNRAYAENKDDIDLIPWGWGCNYGRCKDPSRAGNTKICPDHENFFALWHTCYSFHFLTHKYRDHIKFKNPRLEYDGTFNKDPQDLLRSAFIPQMQTIANCI